MTRYANIVEDFVVEIFDTPNDQPITEFFPEQMLWVNLQNHPNVRPNWIAKEVNKKWEFTQHTGPAISVDDIIRVNSQTYEALRLSAISAMTPLLLAIQLNNATDKELEDAKTWQQYYRELLSVDPTTINPTWPTLP